MQQADTQPARIPTTMRRSRANTGRHAVTAGNTSEMPTLALDSLDDAVQQAAARFHDATTSAFGDFFNAIELAEDADGRFVEDSATAGAVYFSRVLAARRGYERRRVQEIQREVGERLAKRSLAGILCVERQIRRARDRADRRSESQATRTSSSMDSPRKRYHAVGAPLTIVQIVPASGRAAAPSRRSMTSPDTMNGAGQVDGAPWP